MRRVWCLFFLCPSITKEVEADGELAEAFPESIRGLKNGQQLAQAALD